MFNKFAKFAKAGWENANPGRFNFRNNALIILGITAPFYISIDRIQKGVDAIFGNLPPEDVKLDDQLTLVHNRASGLRSPCLKRLEKIKKMTLDIEEKTKTDGITWYLGTECKCRPLLKKIVLNRNESPETLEFGALHEVGHLKSSTKKAHLFWGPTVGSMVACCLFDAYPTTRVLTVSAQLLATVIAGYLAHLKGCRYEEKKADKFASQYLFEEFKKGNVQALKCLKIARADFLASTGLHPEGLKQRLEQVLNDPRHPSNRYRALTIQRYVDLCEKYNQTEDPAPQHRTDSLQELRGILLD
jgi:hypothetical protein